MIFSSSATVYGTPKYLPYDEKHPTCPVNPYGKTKLIIEGVLDVSEMRVRDIMIPRSQMVTIDRNHNLNEFLPIILESGHSRFPVVNEDID